MIAFSLGGCSTYFHPTIGMLSAPPVPETAVKNMPNLAEVVKASNKKLEDLETHRDSSLTTNRRLGVATFGLGVAAAGYGLYGSHAHAMKNLALASGVTYMGSSLFAPQAQTDIYQAGILALACINNKASPTLYQLGENIQLVNDTQPHSPESLKCTPDSAKLAKQNAAYEKAKEAANLARTSDPRLADIARSASNNVLQELDRQLISLTPSPDAILNAAKTLVSSSGVSLSTGSSGQSSPASPAGTTGARNYMYMQQPSDTPPSLIPACNAEQNKLLDERTANYQAMANALTAAMNLMDDLSTACTLSTKAVAAITLSQEEVTLTKDIKFVNVVIRGGREPYLLTQQEIPGVTVNLIQPNTLNIIVTDAAKLKAGSQNLEIRDSSTVTTPKQLRIVAK